MDRKRFKLKAAILTTEGLQQVKEIEMSKEVIQIPLEPMTEADIRKYEEYKRRRNERVYRKFGVEYDR